MVKINRWGVQCRQYVAYLGVRLFVCVLQSLRIETCHAVARLLATICHRVVPLRRSVIEQNLRLAFPKLSADERATLAWRMWEHLFLVVAEVAHAPRKIHETNWRNYVTFVRGDLTAQAVMAERPSLMVAAHHGNFELGGYLMGILGFPTYSVARPLDNPHIDVFVKRFRGVTGQRVVPKKGGYERILEVLAHGGMMAFLADQYAGSKGCWVEFFGRPASAHKAIALLALDSRAPILIGSTRRLGRPMQFVMEIHDVVDPAGDRPEVASVKSLTQWYTSTLEASICQAPEQYWWLHRRWKDNRPARRRQSAAA